MQNAEWRMENGDCRMENAECRMENYVLSWIFLSSENLVPAEAGI